jgi:hypothetical protein
MEIWNIFFFLSAVLFLIALYLLKLGAIPHWLQDTHKPIEISREKSPRRYWYYVGSFVFFACLFTFFGFRLI